MKRLCITIALVFAAAPGVAKECTFEERQPVEKDGRAEYRFVDSCGEVYEVGYRIEGNTLHFPRGGQHTLPDITATAAEQILRETYGLVGEPDALIRTEGF